MKKSTWILLACLVIALPVVAQAQTVEAFDVPSGELLELDLETGGSVEIRGWDRSEVRVELEERGRGVKPKVDIRRTDSGVAVKIEENDWHERGDRGHRDHKGYRVKVRVPLKFNIQIETMGGGITIADVEGEIEGETMGGQLDLSNLKGELDLSTMGGSIRLVDSEVNGEVSTMGGKVLLENVIGDVDGSSMGGNVVYKNVQRSDGSTTGKVVHITTMGGEIELAEAPHGAKLHTMGGKIEVQSAAEFVDAETMGGDVILHEVDGRVAATTMGGDVEVRVIGDPQAGDRSIELTSMGGEIHLTVPHNFSMEVDIELSYTKRRAGRYDIHSDLTLQRSEEPAWNYDHGSARKVIKGSGVFAGGKNKVVIRTINGDVHLRQGG
ncbi:MAG: DUF4097 family beta strand repeat-containing protein [Thermoanaerobaculia bacterium]